MSSRNPFDAMNKSREAYQKGVEINRRVRETAYEARAMAAARQAREAYEREARARYAASADEREHDAFRQVPASDQGWIDTYNIYMESFTTGEVVGGEDIVDVAFQVVPESADSGYPDRDAVIAGLDLVDLINLRDALILEIDTYALSVLEAQLRDR